MQEEIRGSRPRPRMNMCERAFGDGRPRGRARWQAALSCACGMVRPVTCRDPLPRSYSSSAWVSPTEITVRILPPSVQDMHEGRVPPPRKTSSTFQSRRNPGGGPTQEGTSPDRFQLSTAYEQRRREFVDPGPGRV